MQYIRRTLLGFTVTVLAVLTGSGTALAGPAPLIDPEHATTVVDKESSSGGFFDSWPQVTLAIVVGIAVLALLAYVASRLRHHAPSAA